MPRVSSECLPHLSNKTVSTATEILSLWSNTEKGQGGFFEQWGGLAHTLTAWFLVPRVLDPSSWQHFCWQILASWTLPSSLHLMKCYCVNGERSLGSFTSQPHANDSMEKRKELQGVLCLIGPLLFIKPDLLQIFKTLSPYSEHLFFVFVFF